MTLIAWFVFMRRAPDSASYPVHVLVRLGAVLREVDSRTEHTANVGMPLVEAFLHDGIDKWWPVEEHPLACLVAILFGYFFPPMNVALPQFAILDFLHL